MEIQRLPKMWADVFRYLSAYDGWHEMCFRCGYDTKFDSTVETEETLSEASLGKAEGGVLVNE